jgi:hypothetical protein
MFASRPNAGAQPRGPLPVASRSLFGSAAPVGCSGLLAHESVVLCVGADPEPDNARWTVDAEYTVMKTDASGPDPIDALEMERRVLRV